LFDVEPVENVENVKERESMASGTISVAIGDDGHHPTDLSSVLAGVIGEMVGLDKVYVVSSSSAYDECGSTEGADPHVIGVYRTMQKAKVAL